MFKDFKQFALRGNVVDLAVGVIIGGAFGKIVSSLVNDIIMPPLGKVMGNINFSNLFLSLSGGSYKTLADAQAAGATTINYGTFINNIIDFVIVAFSIFLVIRGMNRLQRKPEVAPTTKSCPQCTMSIPVAASRCPHCTSSLT